MSKHGYRHHLARGEGLRVLRVGAFVVLFLIMGSVINGYIATFSGNFNMAVLLWPLLSLLLTVPFLVVLYRRDGWLRLTAVFAIYASILYAAGLVCFTLYPLPSGDSGPGITYGIPPILDPLNFVHDIARGGLSAVLQLLFNVVLFVPLGFVAKTLLRLGLLSTAGISLAATCLIETAQLTGLFGVYPFAFRTFDVNDLMCNTLGGLIGWALGHLAVMLTRRGPEGLPPVTHRPGFARRCVTLWTDAMIIDVCSVVPRMVVVVGLRVALGESSVDAAFLDRFNAVASLVCFVVAFVIVEVVVPWRSGGCTPSGMFYRMSCETRERAGLRRTAFYALRAAMLFALMVFPRFALLPLALFYLAARQMPYDLVPAGEKGALREEGSVEGDEPALASAE